MGLVKTVARKFGFPLLTKTGFVKFFGSFSDKKRLIVMYHGVVKQLDFDLSVNHTNVVDFEEQIDYFSRNFKIVPLQEIFNSYDGEDSQIKQIAITFDDGYENNYINAFPILRKYNAPATIFVVTKSLENPEYILWYDLFDIIKQKMGIEFFRNNSHLLPSEKSKLIDNAVEWNTFRKAMKKLNVEEKEMILQRSNPKVSELLAKANTEYKNLLNINQMNEMIASGLIEIGSHTHQHPNLDEINIEVAKDEIIYSKKLLEQKLNYKIKSFAFPDGAYNEQIKHICINAGYKNLLAVDYKMTSDLDDKYILQRFCISNTTTTDSNIFQIFNAFKKKGF
ncbi:MAG TPA: polysaccharide deacetylase family protein [Chitinophagales bacterium]|nr:polysaccharide deacetylase family protein [Chitinophagales bacterium]